VICSKCGEVNSDTFRFCGMCGTLLDTRLDHRLDPRLEAPVETRRPVGAPAPGLPKMANAPEPLRPLFVDNATKPRNHQVPPISGPSMLGLNQPGANQSSPTQPSMDSLREKAFSGLDSFFEPEPPKTGGRRLLLLLVLLAALGVAGWWTYTNYLGVAAIRKPETAASNTATASTDEAPSATPPTKPMAKDAAPAPYTSSSQAAVPPAETAAGQGENTNAAPATNQKTVDEAKPMALATTPKLTPKMSPKNAPAERSAARHEPSVAPAKAAKLPAPAAVDTGDAEFHKGEAYLYGRGAAENCDQAVKFLKAASAKSNARARSAFGTMYATGHCVARDLPTSYLWFAMALQVDPNNQILEKDLNAVWNQMTPPERQIATRAKQ
jgi:hypothetical protein